MIMNSPDEIEIVEDQYQVEDNQGNVTNVDFLNKDSSDIETMFFKDHYMFQMHDVHAIEKKFNSMAMKEKLILVTEKDASRIVSMPNFPEALKQVIYSIPIRVKILNDQEQLFIQKITSYVTENSRNS